MSVTLIIRSMILEASIYSSWVALYALWRATGNGGKRG